MSRVTAAVLAVLAATVGMTAVARADAFDFKDVDGFERCMKLDHLVETIKTQTGAQTRFLDPSEIQPRCIDAAVKLLTPPKSKDVILSFIGVVKRESAVENAIPLGALAAALTPAACNDIAIYEVLIAGLGHSGDSYVERAKGLAHRCMKDKDFRKDFTDELKNSDADVRAHACEVLLDEKLVKSCPRSKS